MATYSAQPSALMQKQNNREDDVQQQPGAARSVSTAAFCHALRIRLRNEAEAAGLVSRYADVAARWLAANGHVEPRSPVRLWIESLPYGADTQVSMRRRATELDLALAPHDGIGLRATLLHYEDGDADLILVASRAMFGLRALRRLAGQLIEIDPLDDVALAVPKSVMVPTSSTAIDAGAADADETLAALRRCTFGSGLNWGREEAGCGVAMPDRHMGEHLPHVWQPHLLIAAIGLVLCRFDSDCVPVLGMLDETASSKAPFGVRLLPIAPDVDATVAQFADTIHARLSSPAVIATRETREALSSVAGFCSDVAIGALLDVEPGRATQREIEYRPFLARPFPLTVSAATAGSGRICLAYDFDRNTFDMSAVQSFASCVEAVYAAFERALSAGGQMLLTDVEHMGASQAVALAAHSRGRDLPGLPRLRIEQRIAELAARQPDAPALSYAGERLSYGELEQLAARMAEAMRMLGVCEGDRVGVCLDRSLELVPALLAVMKAGATYVPLDPAYPDERLLFTIADARPSMVIASTAKEGIAASVPTVTIVRLVELAGQTDVPREPAHRAGPDAAAYVIYTSGSTGRPKGVVVPHRNVMALVEATREDLGLNSTDVWTLFHSSAFDFSVWEIWGCLTTGGHLIVVPYWTSRSPDEFMQLLVQERVTVLNQTPSAFAQLQDAESRGSAALAVRLVIFGGEPLDTRMLLAWFDRHPESECRLVNMFGITETTVHVTAQTITRRHALANSRSVGRAIPGWHVYVMDSRRRMLPPGVAGEIYVGGLGVALHYLNRDDLSAERFVVDPYFGERMYRSGDRGRLTADGRLEHLGRLDRQVKIRGFRIELDEIRSVLLDCAEVAVAAVIVNGRGAAARLDAYVILDHGTTTEVRRQVARVLPEHMVPSTITAVSEFPLTPNGKLDEGRLPPPVLSSFATFNVHAPKVAEHKVRDSGPTTDAVSTSTPEAVLQRIWSNVLGVDAGLDDNFFELGGNSLFAVRIAAAVREGGHGDLPLREFYVRQTVRAVAAYLRGN